MSMCENSDSTTPQDPQPHRSRKKPRTDETHAGTAVPHDRSDIKLATGGEFVNRNLGWRMPDRR